MRAARSSAFFLVEPEVVARVRSPTSRFTWNVFRCSGPFSLAQTKVLGQIERQGQIGQGVRAHQIGFDLGLPPLVQTGKAMVDEVGNEESEDRVTQKLERLVVQGVLASLVSVGPVGEGALQQSKVAEGMPQDFLEPLQIGLRANRHCRGSGPRSSALGES